MQFDQVACYRQAQARAVRLVRAAPCPVPPIEALEEARQLLRRLRLRIALELRSSFDLSGPTLAPEFLAQRGPRGRLAVNTHNPAYPVIVATALDAFAAAGGSYAKAARSLGLTTSQLLRFLRADPQVWRAAEQLRSKR